MVFEVGYSFLVFQNWICSFWDITTKKGNEA